MTSMLLAPARPSVATMLESADVNATNGWLGEALDSVGRAHAEAVRQYGYASDVTLAIERYRAALRADYFDTSTVEYDADALRAFYLAVCGALVVENG